MRAMASGRPRLAVVRECPLASHRERFLEDYMSDQPTERVCVRHCEHGTPWMQNGHCVYRENIDADFCWHVCTFSPQPTEKHEHPENETCDECQGVGQVDRQHAKTIANELVAKWLIDNSGFHVGLSDGNTEPDYNDLVVRIADAYEAQAVRIAELENENTSLKNVAEANINAGVEMAGRIRELENALTKIEAWEMPDTGRTWDDGSPMSYAACWGTNGEQDHIRGIARAALKPKEAQ